jgi:hypothetical protein
LRFRPIEERLIVPIGDEQFRRACFSYVFVVRMPEKKDPGNAPTRTQTEADSSVQSREK